MKIKISIVMFLIISFLNMGAISDVNMFKSSFDNLEAFESTQNEFEQNGVKLQYKTKEYIPKEILRIKKYLNTNIIGDYISIDKNQFKCSNEDCSINVKLWNENKYTYVEIILINTNNRYKTLDLKNILNKIKNKKSECTQYFIYCEYKINQLDKTKVIDELINKNDIKKMNLLSINNGCTGTGYLSNGQKINFALTNYNTGSHIIIGTPIIFTTY